MNSFFASCEQHLRPELRGKPVAVTPTLANSGCVIAASYEAKAQGVKTGWRVGDARKQIPDIVIAEARPREYVRIHEQIATFLVEEISPDPLKLSVDEFAIPLDKREQFTPNAHALALFIKQRLSQIFSPALRCSIGIGPNIFLAKLGTELQKPDGLVIIQTHTLELAYSQIKLRDIPGINWGMSHQLHALGIRTPSDLFRAPRDLLHQAFGISGDAWWYNLHGYRVNVRTNPTKSLSHSHVLAPELRTKEGARPVLYKLLLKVAERLREKQLAATHILASARSQAGRAYSWSFEITTQPTQDAFAIMQATTRAYSQADIISPLKMTVIATGLQPYTASPSLFGETTKASQLFKAIDTINASFGRWTIEPASLLQAKESAPNRITFRVPDFAMD